jgi:tRNA pseudouridine38-40 synthase
MPRFAFRIEYHGGRFAGWQRQDGQDSVQAALEAALARLEPRGPAVVGAGRTDAGVHALEQVVHFDAPARRPLSAWVRGVNTLLPRSIAVRWAHETALAFHARYSARGRAYAYLLRNCPQRPGLHHAHLGWHHHPLDVERMREAARILLGTHDFSAFRAAECQARSPVKELRRAGIERHGDLIVFEFAADAFLHHMVRNMVGCLVQVGNGSRSPAWLREVLEGRDRERAAPTFPATGLYLTAVEYDPVWGLPVRAPVAGEPLRALGLPALMAQ